MNRSLLITLLGLALWLSVLPQLFLLPTTEVAQYVELFKENISEHSKCLPNCDSAELELKSEINNYLFNVKEQEKILWLKWFALFSLILLAVVGWVLFKINKPIAKWLILLSSALLIFRSIVFYSTSYSGFIKAILEGSVHLLPWQIVSSSVFYLFIMPLALVILTIIVFSKNKAD